MQNIPKQPKGKKNTLCCEADRHKYRLVKVLLPIPKQAAALCHLLGPQGVYDICTSAYMCSLLPWRGRVGGHNWWVQTQMSQSKDKKQTCRSTRGYHVNVMFWLA